MPGATYNVRQQGGTGHDRRSPGLGDLFGAFRPREGDPSAAGEMDFQSHFFDDSHFMIHNRKKILSKQIHFNDLV